MVPSGPSARPAGPACARDVSSHRARPSQLFRYHLVAFLTSLRAAHGGGDKQLTDDDMVRWANEKVAGSGSASTMRDFHDKTLASGIFLIDLLAAIEPRSVNREHVTPGATAEEQALNAKYAISAARKIGCALFLLHEDIVDVRPKMILSFVASVMAVAMSKS